MSLVRDLLVFAILATSLSTVAFVYDLGDDSSEKNQTPKETKRGGKGILRHRKIASAPTSSEQNATTTAPATNEKTNLPQ